jgi:hypothetical protein
VHAKSSVNLLDAPSAVKGAGCLRNHRDKFHLTYRTCMVHVLGALLLTKKRVRILLKKTL